MPYTRITKLPRQVKDNLPKDAQQIYKEAYNNAWEQYKDPQKRKGDDSREEVSQKVAWSAVKKKFKKEGEKWKRK